MFLLIISNRLADILGVVGFKKAIPRVASTSIVMAYVTGHDRTDILSNRY